MRTVGLAVAAAATSLGLWLGLQAPDTTPVDPGVFSDAQPGGGGR